MQLRVSALPEQKIAQALLAAGADEQVDLAGVMRAVIDLVQQASKSFGIEMRIAGGAARGLQNAVLGRVIDRDAQVHPRAVGGHALALLDGAQQTVAQAGRGGR